MGWKDHLGAITGTVLLPGFGTAVGGYWDKKQKDKKDAAQSALDQANADQRSRMAALESGLYEGEKRAEGIYGSSPDLAGRLASARKFSQEQMQKGFQAGEFDALRGQDIQTQASSLKGGMQNLQSKLASQGIRGGAAMKASAALGQRSSQDLAVSDRARTALSAQLMRQGAEDVSKGAQGDISRSEAMRLAEGGLNLAATTGGQYAQAASQPTSGSKFGMAICGTLLSYGLMSRDLHAKENIVVSGMNPKIVEAYNKTSPAVVNIMNQNEAIRPVIAKLTNAWANEITKEEPNLLGKIVNTLGQSFLKIVSKIS